MRYCKARSRDLRLMTRLEEHQQCRQELSHGDGDESHITYPTCGLCSCTRPLAPHSLHSTPEVCPCLSFPHEILTHAPMKGLSFALTTPDARSQPLNASLGGDAKQIENRAARRRLVSFTGPKDTEILTRVQQVVPSHPTSHPQCFSSGG
jgi:hypothetical protein